MPPVPSTIGRYQILELVGRGGMGALYRARDPVLERDVALKVMLDVSMDSAGRERFTREAKAVAHLQHRNIVIIHDYGEADGVPYIAMEFLTGQDLESMIRNGVPGLLPDRIDLVLQLCRGLGYAHEHGIVHRDIKPANIRVLDDGTVKILDFGLARFAVTSLTESGKVVGTPRYMAPEQIMGQRVDARADLFSVGVLLYELVAGQPPFDGATSVELMYQILHRTPPGLRTIVPDVPEQLEHIVARSLEKDPANRYASASEMAGDLRTVKATLIQLPGPNDTTPSRIDVPADIAPRPRTSRSNALVTAAGLLVLAVALAVLRPWAGKGGTVAPISAPPASSGTTGAATTSTASAPDTGAATAVLNKLAAKIDEARHLVDALPTESLGVLAANGIIAVLDEIIEELTTGGQVLNAAMLAQAYELRARARSAAGDQRGTEQDLAAVLKIDPGYKLAAGTLPNVTVVFDRIIMKSSALPPASTPPAVVPPPVASSRATPPPAPAALPPPPPSMSIAPGNAIDPLAGGTSSAAMPPPPAPRVEVVRPPPTASSSATASAAAIEPTRRKYVAPVYPAYAITANKTGTVYIDLTIGTNGKVIATKVIKSEVLLDQAALDAVRQWEYEPTLVDGVPVTLVVRIGVKFSIDEPEGLTQ